MLDYDKPAVSLLSLLKRNKSRIIDDVLRFS
jgi:hypothetical protein